MGPTGYAGTRRGSGPRKTCNEGAIDRRWRLTRGMREKSANSDAAIAKVAARQHGVASASQLISAGIDKDGIARRVQAGRLHRLHRGVYAVGLTRLTFEGRC